MAIGQQQDRQDEGRYDPSGLQARARGESGHGRGDEAARSAVTNNRVHLKSGVAREAFKLRAEIVERSFAHNLDRRGRPWPADMAVSSCS